MAASNQLISSDLEGMYVKAQSISGIHKDDPGLRGWRVQQEPAGAPGYSVCCSLSWVERDAERSPGNKSEMEWQDWLQGGRTLSCPQVSRAWRNVLGLLMMVRQRVITPSENFFDRQPVSRDTKCHWINLVAFKKLNQRWSFFGKSFFNVVWAAVS